NCSSHAADLRSYVSGCALTNPSSGPRGICGLSLWRLVGGYLAVLGPTLAMRPAGLALVLCAVRWDVLAIIVPIAGVQLLRAAVDRTAAEWMTAMLCALVAIAQISALWNSCVSRRDRRFLARSGGSHFHVGWSLLERSGRAEQRIRAKRTCAADQR